MVTITQWSSLGAVLSHPPPHPRGHLTTSGDTLGGHNWRLQSGRAGQDRSATGITWVEEMPPQQRMIRGYPPIAQWLRLHTSNVGGLGSIPGGGTEIPQATWRGQKVKHKKKKMIWPQMSRMPRPRGPILTRRLKREQLKEP